MSAEAASLHRAESLRVIDGEAGARWDAFVSADPQSTFCHLAGWKEIMTDTLGHEFHFLRALDNEGEWRGVLPLVRVRTVLGHYLISLPFVNDGGPIGEPAAQGLLVQHAVSMAEKSGAGLLELRSRHDVSGPVAPSNRRISVHLALPSSVELLWKNTLRTKQRTKIRRPAKEGMTFESGPEHLDAFYAVFARNMRDLGTPVLPVEFFRRISSVFGAQVMFAVVYTSAGQPVASACCTRWRDEIEVTWGSSLREFNHLSPNMMLYCRLMEEAIGMGLSTFNFGRCTPGGGTHDFKQQWGGRDIPLPWPSWSRHAGAGVPSADKPLFRFATAAWQKLPVPVANRVGPILARMLP